MTIEERDPVGMEQSSHEPVAAEGHSERARRRLAHEWATVIVMIEMYCRDVHGSHGTLCEECLALAKYARERLARCPFLEDKPTCARCPIHCYKPAMRAAMRTVMRYSGPRMFWRHPWLALRHMANEWFGGCSKTRRHPPPHGA